MSKGLSYVGMGLVTLPLLFLPQSLEPVGVSGESMPMAVAKFFGAFGIVMVVGFALILIARNVRVECDEEGLTFFDYLGARTFSAKWRHIKSYRKRGEHEGARSSWTLESEDSEIAVPWLANFGEFQLLISQRLPGSIIQVGTPPPATEPKFETLVRRSNADALSLGYLAWIVLEVAPVVYLLVTAFLSPNSGPLRISLAIVCSCLLIILGPFRSIKRNLDRIRKSQVEISDAQICFTNGETETRIQWSELTWLELQSIKGAEFPGYQLVVLSKEQSIFVPCSFADMDQAFAIGRRYAPPEARIIA